VKIGKHLAFHKDTMSHIKGNISRSNNSKNEAVGKTYGDRRLGGNQLQSALAGKATPSSRRYSQAKTKPAQAERFLGNVSFKKGLSRFMGAGNTPHKPRPLHNMETGSAAAHGQKEVLPPSDAALEKFLNKIIDTPQLHNQRLARKAFSRGTPIKKS